MKKDLFLAIASLGFALFTQAQPFFANRNLSNLLSPTAVNQDLLPNHTNTRDLGSLSRNWKDLYLGGSIFKGSLRFLSNEGTQNTFLGISAGNAITTGSDNTALGYQALLLNITGSFNTATGTEALYNNTASRNSAFGFRTLYSNTRGERNTAIGVFALTNNTIGSANTAVGGAALDQNTTGFNNTATGWAALSLNTTGFHNAAHGALALFNNTVGQFNTATGTGALQSNTTGNQNTANGFGALSSMITGERNTAMGAEAILGNTAGSDNTGIGWQVLRGNAGGSNVAIGHGAGRNFHTSACTFLGTLSESLGLFANSTAIGYQAAITATDQVRIGNSSVTSIGGFADWTNFSDERYKKNIKEDVPGLAFITQLKPITYTLDIEGLEKSMKANAPHMSTGVGKPAVEPELSQQEITAKKARAKEIHTGFVAQEVEAVAKKLNYSFNGIDAPKNDKDFYGLRYAEFVVPLVKAVQELDAENKKMKEEMKELRQIILNLMSSNVNNGSPRMNMSGAYLEQNAPNPFNSTTTIRYNVPMESASAWIVITNMKGQLVKTITVNNKGTNQIILSGGELAAGSYVYSLWMDDKQVDSKRMILTK